MMKTRWIKTTGTIALALVLVTGINAQPRNGRGLGPCGQGYGPRVAGNGPDLEQEYGNRPGPGRRAAERLNLTEEQREEMNALRAEHYKTMKPLRAQMAEFKARERTIMSVEDVDMKALNRVIDDQTSLMNKMKKLQAEHRIETRGLLTEEQQMILDQRGSFGRVPRWKGAGRIRPGGPGRG
jgi:Spy/CpxP family protein refolding chaperone